jgi:hypothetical protein
VKKAAEETLPWTKTTGEPAGSPDESRRVRPRRVERIREDTRERGEGELMFNPAYQITMAVREM